MDKKDCYNSIYRELTSLGFEYRKETIGKSFPVQLDKCAEYFCEYYCKYSDMCSDYADFNCDMPWCPIEVLR